MRINSRGQVATEYLTIIATLLIFLAILVGVSLTTYYSTVKTQQIIDSLEELENAANNVYALGQGNALKVKITLPSETESSTVSGTKIGFKTSGFEESSIFLDLNVHGSLPATGGVHYIKVQAVDGNVFFEEI